MLQLILTFTVTLSKYSCKIPHLKQAQEKISEIQSYSVIYHFVALFMSSSNINLNECICNDLFLPKIVSKKNGWTPSVTVRELLAGSD